MKLPEIVLHYSRKIRVCASFLLLFCAVPHGVLAAGDYRVDGVVAESDGKDATEARGKALAAGEKNAFAQLVARMAPSPAAAARIIAETPASRISPMIRGYSIVEEKMGADHYHATLTYTFDAAQVQAVIPVPPPAASPAPASPPSPAGTLSPASPASPSAPSAPPPSAEPPAERERKAVLVLPVYNDGGALSLWQDENRWRSIWYEAALESGGGLVVVPLGDLNDRVDVDDSNVNAATTESLRRIYGRYGVGQVMVASAFFNQKADPKPALEVSLRKILPGKSEVSQQSFTIHSTENLEALMLRASSDIARQIFKQQTLDPHKIEYDRQKEIKARVNTTDIKEWQALRQKLLMRGNIVDVKLLSISYYETTMIISYKGTADMLGKTLVASGLRVLEDGDSLVLSLK